MEEGFVYSCSECSFNNANEITVLNHLREHQGRSDTFYSDCYAITSCEATKENSAEDAVSDNEKIWTKENVHFFLSVVQKHWQEFEMRMKKFVWVQVAKEMSEKLNKSITFVHCETKWKSMKRTYKTILENNNTSGRKQKDWEYFPAMHELLFAKPEISPLATCDSHEGLVVRNLKSPSTNRQSTSVDNTDTISNSSSGIEETQSNNIPFISQFSRKGALKQNVAEQRHQEKLARQDRFLNLLEQIVQNM